jgi:hypothetical protein
MKRHACEQIREQLLDAMSPAAPLPPALAEHLRACAECNTAADSLRKTWQLLDDWAAPEPSPYFDSKLQARLREEKANPERAGLLAWLSLRWQPVLAGALALVLGVVLGVTRLYTPAPTISQTSSPAVSDLETFDKNADVYNFDMLYGDDQQQAQTSDQ